MGNEKPKIVLIGSVMFILIHVAGILTLGKLYSVNGVAISFVLAVTSEMTYLFFMNKFIKIKK